MRTSSNNLEHSRPSRSAAWRSRRLAATFVLGALAVVAASCADTPFELDSRSAEQTPGTAAQAPASVGRQPSVSAPFDIAGVMRQVHFAYRPDGAAFLGGHTTYEVHASAGGFSVTPARTDLPRNPGHAGPPEGALGEPATFETLSLGRGDARKPADHGEPHVEPDGHLVLPQGDAEEHLENTEEGVEQRWAFAHRPEGEGDLVIRVRVSGEEYVGATEGGHHFADHTTGLGLRYGKATWIDATGERTPLSVIWRGDEGALELSVPAEIVEKSSYPAVLDPAISPEYGTDNPIQGSANGEQRFPDMVFDGTNYLIAWQDDRVAATDIYGAQVSANGNLLTPGGITLATGALGTSSFRRHALGFDGTNCLIAWTIYDGFDELINVKPISTAGVALGPVVQYTSIDGMRRPALAFDGTNYLLVYDAEDVTGLLGMRLSKAGAKVGSGFNISPGSGDRIDAEVAFDGTNYLVVWRDNRTDPAGDIYGARVTPAGTVLDPNGIPISLGANGQVAPEIAFDGTNYLVVWEDGRWGNPDIYGSRVSKSGLVLDPSGIEISKTTGAQTAPNVAFDGTRYVVAWGDARSADADLYAARVLPNATVLDPSGIQLTSIAGSQQEPAIACATTSCLVAFADKRSTTFDIWGARIDGSGAVLDPNGFPVSSSANEQRAPVLEWGSGQYLAVWQDHRAWSNWDIYGTRIGPTGVVLDPNGITISADSGDQQKPDVSWNGSNWLVVWEDLRSGTSSDIYGARVQPDGALLDGSGVAISTTTHQQLYPAIAYDGTNHLVVWSDSRSGINDIYGARVTPGGVLLDASGVVLGAYTNTDTTPDVAFDGTNYLVVWANTWNGTLFGSRVTPAATLLNASTGFGITVGQNPALVYDGLNFMVVLEKNGYDVYGARVTSAGAVVDPNGFTIATTSAEEGQPTVIRDGQRVFVAWRRNLQTNIGSIYGSWVDQAGSLSNPGGFAISSLTNSHHSNPAVAADGAGSVLAAYQRRAISGVSTGHDRTYFRVIAALPAGQACSEDAGCASGFCVDGVCCNAACGGNDPNDCFACSVAAGAAVNGSCAPLDAVPCSDGNGCTVADACVNGTCMAGAPNDCKAPDSCHLDGTCNQATGTCQNAAKPNGTACDDGSGCTKTDTCQAGACVGANPVVCPADTACTTVSACDPATGACIVSNEPDGTLCDDGNACTQISTCQAGQCMGMDGVVCPPPTQCQQPGTCNPATGTCTYTPKANGTACDDGNSCTQADTCQAGACVGANPVVCPASTDCQSVAACNPATGTCATTNAPDGKACNDGNACTQKDACQAGECVGTDAIVCAPPGPCHQAVSCDKASGQCVYSDKPNGTACDDGNACTALDTCKAGACVGANPSSCEPSDECHEAGSCDPGTGACSNPPKADGAPCSGGSCVGGVCKTSPDGGTQGSGGGGMGGQGGAENQGGSGGSDSPAESGCGCRTAPQSSRLSPLALLTLGLLGRRRRRSAARRG